MRTITCDEVRAEIPLYLEGELLPEENMVTAFHLAACEPCTATAELDRRLLRGPGIPEGSAPPDGLVSNVIGTLRRARKTAGSPAALKWGSLGIVILLTALSRIRLAGGPTVAWSIISGLGEILHADRLLSTLLGLLPDLWPSVYSDLDPVLAGGRTGSAAEMAAHAPSAAIVAIMLLSLMTLATSLIAGASRLLRGRLAHRRSCGGILTRS